MRTELKAAILGAVIGVALAVLFHRCAARAQEHDRSVELLAAQACWLESSFSVHSCTAEMWVWFKNAKIKPPLMSGVEDDERFYWAIADYEHALWARSKRAAFARRLPWGDSPELSAKENGRWAELRARVLRVLGGAVADPYPRARHFGSRTHPVDRARAQRAIDAGRWRLLKTDTRQAFYAMVRR